MSHARPPPDRRPPPSQRLWAALRPSPQATPGQTDAAYTPTDTKALALKHQGVEPGAAVEAAAAPPAAVAAVSSPAIAAPAAVVPRKDSLFTSPLARNTSLSEPVTPAEIKRVTQLQQFDSLSRKATKEEEDEFEREMASMMQAADAHAGRKTSRAPDKPLPSLGSVLRSGTASTRVASMDSTLLPVLPAWRRRKAAKSCALAAAISACVRAAALRA